MDSPQPRIRHQQYEQNKIETKLCIIIDSRTPIIIKTSTRSGQLTLSQFKEITCTKENNLKFYFKSYDQELGVVKEEITDDDAILPVDGDKIVAWIITNDLNQSSLFDAIDRSRDRTRRQNLSSPTSLNSHLNYRFTPSPSYSLTNETNFEIHLRLNQHYPLGLTFVGPKGSFSDRGLYVGHIATASIADQDGRIRLGDKIIEINGIEVEMVRTDEANAVFRNAVDKTNHLKLLIQRTADPIDHSDVRPQNLPRESLNSSGHYKSRDRINSHIEELPVPIFDQQCNEQASRTAPLVRNRTDHKGTNSLPRSITPRSLYAINNFTGLTTNESLRLDSRSIYEPISTNSIRQFSNALHFGRDDVFTIYAALRADAKSLDIKDREWLKVTVKNAFLGSAMIKWLTRNVYGFCNKREVKQYANQMLSLGLIKSPISSSKFSEKCYYIFE